MRIKNGRLHFILRSAFRFFQAAQPYRGTLMNAFQPTTTTGQPYTYSEADIVFSSHVIEDQWHAVGQYYVRIENGRLHFILRSAFRVFQAPQGYRGLLVNSLQPTTTTGRPYTYSEADIETPMQFLPQVNFWF
ncbi:uncharacterized protein LOC113475229 [Ciona intestinalis]